MQTKEKFHNAILFFTFAAAVLYSMAGGRAYAYNSKAWAERIAERTATIWVEGQFLGDDIVLNARGELNVTWVERGLSNVLNTDNEVDEWMIEALDYYFSRRKETRAKLKGRDVFALRYRAVKSWNFDPTKLTVDGYAITPEDVLTRKEYWEGEAPPGYAGTVMVAVPSVKLGQKLELRYDDSAAQLEIPRSRAR